MKALLERLLELEALDSGYNLDDSGTKIFQLGYLQSYVASFEGKTMDDLQADAKARIALLEKRAKNA